MPEPSPAAIDAFILKWSSSGGHERGSGQYFLLDFCDLLGLEKPAAPVPENESPFSSCLKDVKTSYSDACATRLVNRIVPGS